MATPVPLAETRCRLGESPVWSASNSALFWVDISGKQLYRFQQGGLRSWQFETFVAAVAPCVTSDHVVLALTDRVALFDFTTETVSELCQPDESPQNRSNDARCDARGRFWLGTMQNNLDAVGNGTAVTQSSGGLYCVYPTGKAEKMLSDLGITNGITWSPDNRTMYIADSLKNCIYAFDFDLKTGDLSRQRVFHEGYDRGVPDGATVDAEGYVWSARYGGDCLVRHAPSGTIDRVVDLPVSNPTSCTFGDDNLDTLIVTSATLGLNTEQLKSNPLEGATLALNVGSRGIYSAPFAT